MSQSICNVDSLMPLQRRVRVRRGLRSRERELSLGCEIRPCLVWTTERPERGYISRSPPFFLRNQTCQFTFSNDCECYTLRVEADCKDQSNYHSEVTLERGNGTGLRTRGVFGHSHPTPKIIWQNEVSGIQHEFPDFFSSYFPFKFVVVFSSTPGDDGKAVEPTLQFTQSETDQAVKTAEMSTQTSWNLNAVSCLETLSGDLSNLLDGDSHKDVEFKCEGGVVRAHSVLLSTRSRVLAAMLRSDMAEGRTGHVDIRDMEPELFRCFIRYLYTGKLPELTIDTARRLYEAGDKYEVEGLTRRCSHFLKLNLSPANACDLLVLAEAHSDQQFKGNVVDFILDKRIFLKDDHWQVFSDGHPKLAHEVLNRFCKQEFGEK